MPTKGPSLRYGNTNGAHNRGQASANINYAWAKGFSKGDLKQHFSKHGKEFGARSKEEYASKAVHFANAVDRQNCKSVVDFNGTTYKYNCKNGVVVIVTQDGYVISYHHSGGKFTYSPKKGEKKSIWIKM